MRLPVAITVFAALVSTMAVQPTVAGAAPKPFRGHSCNLPAMPTSNNDDGLGATNRRSYPLRSTGRLRAIMLFADFPDAKRRPGESTRALHRKLAIPAVRRFKQSSHGKFQLQVRPLHRWLRMPRGKRSYDTDTFAGQHRLVGDAIRRADRSINFRHYPIVLVVSSQRSGIQGASTLHVSGGDSFRADGRRIQFTATFGNYVRAAGDVGGWIVAHEVGHLLGLPDLYSFSSRGDIHRYVGNWDPMGNVYDNTGHTQWIRRKMGWLPGRQVVCLRRGSGGEWTLLPQARRVGKQLIVVPTSRTTAVTIERRSKLGIDAALCDTGVLITRVNARTIAGNGPMRVVPASRSTEGCGTLGHAPFARGEGERCSVVVDGIRIEVVEQSTHTSTVRVRPKASQPDVRVADCG